MTSNCTGWTIWRPTETKLKYQVCEGNGEPANKIVTIRDAFRKRSLVAEWAEGLAGRVWREMLESLLHEGSISLPAAPVWWPLPTRAVEHLEWGRLELRRVGRVKSAYQIFEHTIQYTDDVL